MDSGWDNFWKPDWAQTRERLTAWWRHEGFVLHVFAHRADAPEKVTNTQAPFYYLHAGLDTLTTGRTPADIADGWINPARRVALAEHYLANTFFGGEAFPAFDSHLGPGSLAMFLGSEPDFAVDTVWYSPCITDPDSHPPLAFDPSNPWFCRQKALLEAAMQASGGRYLVTMPDLIENVDTLASLRGTQELMLDFIERPDWVRQQIANINQVYFAAYDALFAVIRDMWGGSSFSAFCIWGPGKTAKVQCDLCAMISPRMFAEFVAPALAEQCDWLDYAMYHLDGTQAIPHLDALLALDGLDAIEWTPQVSLPQGGDPMWYDLYRRILAAGKSVQAIGVKPHEVIPLLEAVGTDGLYLMINAGSQTEAEALVAAVEPYRR